MANLKNLIVNGVSRFLDKVYIDDSQINKINGVTVGSSPKFTDNNTTYSAGTGLSLSGTSFSVKTGYTTSGNNRAVQADSNGNLYVTQKDDNTNTTYTFANGTNGFTVTPSGGSAQTVTVTPSISNNITGSGTSGYIAKFNGGNTITSGPQLGSSTTTYLRNDGVWGTPVGTTYSSKAAASGGTDVSLVTTGEKYTWNNKSNLTIGTTASTAAAGNHTHNYAGSSSAGGSANSAVLVNGTYSGNGGAQPPSFVSGGQVKFAMMNNPKGLSVFPTYCDSIIMDTYTGSDVPWTTMLAVPKQDATPRLFIVNGAKGSTTTWKNSTEAITTGNFTSQALTKSQVTTALGYTPPTTNTTYSAGTGLSLSSTTFNHSNSVTAQTTQAIYPIKIDAQGHISAYGSAVTPLTASSTLDATKLSGTVPTNCLPSYVDDVLEYSAKSSFPSTGESGKIYVDTGTNLAYRWGGSAYVEISPSLALGTTSSTAYRGDYGNAAYTHAVTNKGSAFSSGLYKITTNSEGHVTAATAVAKADITALGIPGSDTNTWRGIQNSLTSDSTTDSLSAAQGKALANGLARDNTKLPKTTYEYNNEISFGGSGKLLIGKFQCYDSNVTIHIQATTSLTYNATAILATQNINTTGGGTYRFETYGDSSNTITPNLYAKYVSGSDFIEIYFSPTGWSKNIVHIQCVALRSAPTNVCESVESIPSDATIQPTNTLMSSFVKKSGDTITGTIVSNDITGRNILQVGSSNQNTNIWRVYSSDQTYADKGVYGYSLQYYGIGSGDNNLLKLLADNQNASTQVEVASVTQAGNVTFGKDVNVTGSLKQNGTVVSLSGHTHNYAGSSSAGGAATSLVNFKATTTTNNAIDTPGTNAIAYASGLTQADWNYQHTDGAYYCQWYSSNWWHEIFGDYRTGQISVRGNNNGTKQSWRRVLDESNYTSIISLGSCSGLTKSQVTTALGYTPPTSDTNTAFSYITTPGDNRSVATAPNDYSNRLIFQGLKNKGTIGNPSSDTYSYLVGLRGWSDSSGGNSHEIAFNDTGIQVRRGATTSWGNWETVYTSANLTSKAAASGGSDVSLVTTGDKYNWNNKTSNTGTITAVTTSAGTHSTVNKTSGSVSFNVPTNTSHLTNDSNFAAIQIVRW